MVKRKSNVNHGMMNTIVAGIDLGDKESLATLLSGRGDVLDRFSFQMSDEGYATFARRVPHDAKVAFEATVMAYPVSRALKRYDVEPDGGWEVNPP